MGILRRYRKSDSEVTLSEQERPPRYRVTVSSAEHPDQRRDLYRTDDLLAALSVYIDIVANWGVTSMLAPSLWLGWRVRYDNE
jgi:hypothetical protein